MSKILTFFNHKGGVGKTTLSYATAWGLSEAGKRVLMIDADPQCNLTEIAIEDSFLYGIDEDDQSTKDSQEFFLKNNIYEYFVDYIQPTPNKTLPAIKNYNKTNMKNLDLLTGSVRFAELDKSISLSLSNVSGLGFIPNYVHEALKKIGENYDFVIIDLSPALSSTNQLLLMLSDYFIAPVSPSIFSRQALMNLGEIFRQWNRELSGFEIFSRKVKLLPKLLGIVCQNYRPYSRADEKDTTSAKRFEKVMSELNNRALDLANDLNSFGMALTPNEFGNIFENSTPYRIANIPDYNQLRTISETEKIPVIALDSKILTKHALNTPTYVKKIDGFKEQCSLIINGLLKL